MRHPSLPLVASCAVAGAMAIAVPALAAPGSSPAAHSAHVRHCAAVIVISHHRRVRACLIQGPRGFNGATGKTGAKGTTGKTGEKGGLGPEGKVGPNGTARAYAVIQPTSPIAASLITPSGITGVTEMSSGGSSGGIYCIATVPSINPAGDTAAVSPEVSYSSGVAPGVIAVNALRTHCPPTDFEVDTFAPYAAPAPPVLTSGYAFTIVIP
jgi:hypothetical protein